MDECALNSGSWEPFEPKPSRFRYTKYRAPEVTETRYERFLRERAEKAAATADEVNASPETSSGGPSLELSSGDAKAMGIDGLPFVKYDAPASAEAKASTSGKQP